MHDFCKEIVMNEDIIKGEWKAIKGKLKEEWGKLTDDDILQINGSAEKLEGLIQRKYGLEKEQTAQDVMEFLKRNGWKK